MIVVDSIVLGIGFLNLAKALGDYQHVPEQAESNLQSNSLQLIDRHRIFLLLFLISTIAFCAAGFNASLQVGNDIATVLLLALHLSIALWFGASNWRDWKNWLMLGSFAVVDLAAIFYLQFEPQPDFQSLSDKATCFQQILKAVGISLILVAVCVPLVALAIQRIGDEVSRRWSIFHTQRKTYLACVTLVLLLYFVLLKRQSLQWPGINLQLLGNSENWNQNRIWLLEIPFLTFCVGLIWRTTNSIESRLVYLLAFAVYVILGLGLLGANFLNAESGVVLSSMIVSLLSVLWLGSKPCHVSIEPRSWNWFSWLVAVAWLGAIVTIPMVLNPEVIYRSTKESRWEYAWETSWVQAWRRPEYDLNVKFEDEITLINVTRTLAVDAPVDCLKNLPSLPGRTEITGIRPDVDITPLVKSECLLAVLIKGEISVDQMMQLCQRKRAISSNGWPTSFSPELENVTVIPGTQATWPDRYYFIDIYSSDPDATTKTLKTLSGITIIPNRRGVSPDVFIPSSGINFYVDHEFTTQNWNDLGAIMSKSPTNAIVYPFMEELETHRKWFDCVPDHLPASGEFVIGLNSQIFLNMLIDPSDPAILSPLQRQLIANDDYRIHVANGTDGETCLLSPMQYHAAIDLAWIADRGKLSGLYFDINELARQAKADVDWATKFHFIVPIQDVQAGEAQASAVSHPSLVLPALHTELLQRACDKYPHIHSAAIGAEIPDLVLHDSNNNDWRDRQSLEPIRQMQQLRRLYLARSVNDYSPLADLRLLEIGKFVCDGFDLKWTHGMDQLKQLSFSMDGLWLYPDTDKEQTLKLGFSASDCPSLERIEIDGQPSIELIQEFSKLKNLSQISLLKNRFNQNQKQAYMLACPKVRFDLESETWRYELPNFALEHEKVARKLIRDYPPEK